jgi:hypothetical protein
MNRYAPPLAILSLLLAVGCADRGDNARNLDEDKASAPAEPEREAAPSERDPATPRDDAGGARGTAGSRSRTAATPSRPSAAARSDAAPRAEAAAEPATPARRGVEWREVTIPANTALPLELQTTLSSETAQIETPVQARLKQALVVNGVTALPAGAIVSGHVTGAERAGRVKGRASLAFTFNQVRADNMTAAIRTAPLSYVGDASRGEDATKIGAGAVGGAIVGGIVGGGEGAAKGAAIGGAAGTGVVLATRGKEVELPSGTDLAATLAAPVTIRVPVR